MVAVVTAEKRTKRSRMRHDEALAVQRWLRGHAAAATRSRQALAAEGPRSMQAVAEAFSALNALAEMGLWPGPRDPANEAAVIEVRRRWARIQNGAIRDRSR